MKSVQNLMLAGLVMCCGLLNASAQQNAFTSQVREMVFVAIETGQPASRLMDRDEVGTITDARLNKTVVAVTQRLP